jgi:hypothetical protein
MRSHFIVTCYHFLTRSFYCDHFLARFSVSPDPEAPFGVVTLASSGAEGADAAMGAMRIAQTGGYGVLPSPELPNTFLAQAYDLDDAWGPAAGPCFVTKALGGWECCDPKVL